MEVRLTVNGTDQRLDVGPGETLLSTLRDRLGLTGTKEACVEGECGACTVLVDGRPLDSCIYATGAADGRTVTTVEGLVGPDGALAPLAQAFVDKFAVQCGFCTPGLVVTLTALLDADPAPGRDDITTALAGNLCRCTGYRQVVEAIESVSP